MSERSRLGKILVAIQVSCSGINPNDVESVILAVESASDKLKARLVHALLRRLPQHSLVLAATSNIEDALIEGVFDYE